MFRLPLFFSGNGRIALVFGSGTVAQRKAQLLLRSGCRVFLVDSDESLWAGLAFYKNAVVEGALQLAASSDICWDECFIAVAAHDDSSLNKRFVETVKSKRIPVNVIGSASASDFVFPSIIDRAPIMAAVSSGGELPILARLIRSRIEAVLPHRLGALAQTAGDYKNKVMARLGSPNARRRFWEYHLEGRFADLIYSGRDAEARSVLDESIASIADCDRSVGEVYLVGAGPGDPDLLSFKALRLMRQADVVLYDRLVSDPILRLVRQDAELIDVGKARDQHTLPQENINALLASLAKEGRRVLRLKGGDPFIFGRGGEEIEKLAEEGIPFQVVPGITAASGCSAYAGIPLTHRDYAQSVRFITGHLKNDTCDLPWAEFVQEQQTLVFYMGLSGLKVICDSLIQKGMPETMPVALVSKGTTPEQKVYVSDLKNIFELSCVEKVKAPTIIIVGDVVRLRDKLKWDSV
jgi:uroporphyrin-III C-methyltransferase / precorrin-2 dehydrogenase / sirohydrochlorin ferrochelatase